MSSGFARVVRGGLWVYLRGLVNNFFGFVYWFVLSAIAGSEIVGMTTATVALASVVTVSLSLGEQLGVQRFVGASRGRGDEYGVGRYFWTASVFSLVKFLPVGVVMVLLGLSGFALGGLDPELLLYAGIITILGPLNIFDGLLYACLETKPIFLGAFLGNLAKLAIGFGLVSIGWGWVGALIGYVSLIPVGFAVKLLPSLRLAGFRPGLDRSALVDIVRAGLPAWLPGMITILGQQLGVLTLFGVRGASETGLYYVSFAIMGVVMGLGASVLGLMMPVLSGMADGRKRACWRSIKLSLSIVTPPALALAAYPELPLGLLGDEYTYAAPLLTLLSLSIPAALINAGIINLLYAYGMYSFILAIGLVGTTYRIAAYIPLSYYMGGFGIALSYSSGAFIALIAAVLVAGRIGFSLRLKETLLITTPPVTLAFTLHTLGLSLLVGAPLILLIPYITYLRLRVLDRRDLRDMAYAVMPGDKVNNIYQHLRPIIDRLID